MKHLYILYVGNFKPWWSTENHIAKTLEKLGHTVERRQEDEIAHDALWPINIDVFLWTRTWPNFISNKVLDFYKSKNIPTLSFHLDLYFGLQRDGGLGEDSFWATDYVFSPDGGHDEEFKKLGINHYYLRAGVLEDECYIHPDYDPKRFDNNIIFVGSYGYHPEHTYRQKLIDWLRSNYPNNFKLYSPQFNNGQQIRGDDLNRLYAKSKIVIGDSLNVGFKQKYYTSDRLYETPGRGGVLIHPWSEGVDESYENGEEMIFYTYGNFNQLAGLIKGYLADDEARENIRMRGHERTKKEHTYTQRVQEMLGVVFSG